jgi:hypothetical protein
MGKPKIKRISRPVYFIIGFVCATPILGGIAGAVFLIAGLTVYKNKALAIIGAAGVLITCTIILYINYNETHRGPYDEGRVLAAERWMGDIIREIELYKLNNDKYPDSLSDVKRFYHNLIIIDPVQQVHPELHDHTFFYKRLNNGYVLFSRGFDGVPFTKDDILPSMDGINPKKIGLVLDTLNYDSIPR